MGIRNLLLGAVFLTFTLGVSYPALAERTDLAQHSELIEMVQIISNELGADWALVAGVVEKESNWRAYAIGDSGRSVGLLMLHDRGVGYGMSVEERQDPALNLRVGIAAMVRYWDRYRSAEQLLAAWVAGPTALDRNGGNWRTLYGGTVAHQYVYPILTTAERYRTGG